jgi:D-sedoheptulose 7-phosphate isomerase
MKDAIRSWLLRSIDVKVKTVDVCTDSVAQAAEMLIECLKSGHKVLLCGNGGSAADSQHMACELVGRFLVDRRALAAIALTTDTSILTAIANDYDYEQVFQRQVQALGQPGDVLLALSTSGNTVNVLKAADAARRQGMKVVALTGETGGQLKNLCDCLIAVPSTMTPHVQESHITVLHVLCELVDKALVQR